MEKPALSVAGGATGEFDEAFSSLAADKYTGQYYSTGGPRLLAKENCIVSGRSGYAGSGFPDERFEPHYVIDNQPLVFGAGGGSSCLSTTTRTDLDYDANYDTKQKENCEKIIEKPEPSVSTAIFGFGCFWCAESIFLHDKALLPGVGVLSTQVGYCGGETAFPTYDEVCSGLTNHAEVVRVQFDESKLPYTELLRRFWLSHDPTTYGQQGNDVGTQYCSIIVCESDAQFREAERSRDAFQEGLDKWKLDVLGGEVGGGGVDVVGEREKSKLGKGREEGEDVTIKTEIVMASAGPYPFYLAEREHQQHDAKPGARNYCGLRPLAIPRGYVDLGVM